MQLEALRRAGQRGIRLWIMADEAERERGAAFKRVCVASQ